MKNFSDTYIEFLTITILEWKRLLQPTKYKELIIESLAYFVKEKRAKIFAFCIMDNHIHLIWQAEDGYTSRDNQHSFTKYTAQKIKYDLSKNHPKVLALFRADAKDRMYQFWERNALAVILYNEPILIQKLNYIHENPVKAGLCNLPEEYFFSSASFYVDGDLKYSFLSHI
jgi:REP element-mobilizing transposase RayT